jgi:anti-sigma factor RsiW
MKHELELKVQAWVDGELPDHEARRIGEWIARDSEAAALAAELGCVRQAMFRQEAAGTLGESREFYWSKIQRQIQREAGVRRTEGWPWYARWRKYMGPLAGVVALACVLVMAVTRSGSLTFDEISSTGEGMEAVTFHDQSAQMTVVWLQDNSPAREIKAAPKSIRYEDEPGTVIELQ